MRYSQSIINSFDLTLDKIPGSLRTEIFGDKYKYLTDLSLLINSLDKEKLNQLKMLDLGGASGLCALVFKEKFNCQVYVADRLDMEWTGANKLEPHPMLSLYEKMDIHFSKVDFRFEKLPFEDNFFDCINAVDIVEHFNVSPKFFLKEIFRVLKPDGILLFGCPNICNLQNKFKVLFGSSNLASLDKWYESEDYKGHIREYTLQENIDMLTKNSFKILSKRMGEEQLLSVLKDKVKLQRDRTANSMTFNLKNPKELLVYLFCGLYYFTVQLFPKSRYFIRVIATK